MCKDGVVNIDIDDAVKEAVRRIQHSIDDDSYTPFLRTGLKTLDKAFGGGFTKSGLHLLAGAARVGKSTVLRTILYRLSVLKRIPVSLVSSHSDIEYQLELFVRELAGIPFSASDYDEEVLEKAANHIAGAPMTVISVNSFNVIHNPFMPEVGEAFYYLPPGSEDPVKDIQDVKLVIIDGLTVRDTNIVEKIRLLQESAREHNCAILVALELPPEIPYDQDITLESLDRICPIVNHTDTIVTVHRGLHDRTRYDVELYIRKHLKWDCGIVSLFHRRGSGLLEVHPPERLPVEVERIDSKKSDK